MNQTHREACRKYEKTPKGFLMRCYRNMQSRVTGVQKRNLELYLGKELLPRQDFYDWALNDPTYNLLFTEWVKQDYSRNLTPSINRIDTDGGYTLDNIEWVTFYENSRQGGVARYEKHRTFYNKWTGKHQVYESV